MTHRSSEAFERCLKGSLFYNSLKKLKHPPTSERSHTATYPLRMVVFTDAIKIVDKNGQTIAMVNTDLREFWQHTIDYLNTGYLPTKEGD